MRIGGLGNIGYIEQTTVPPSPGVSLESARAACKIANGQWTGSACIVSDSIAPPSWCGPFGYTLFDECVTPDASELALIGSYTRYKIAESNQELARLAAIQAAAEAKKLAPASTQEELLMQMPGYVVGKIANTAGNIAGDMGKGLGESLSLSGLVLIAGILGTLYLLKQQ